MHILNPWYEIQSTLFARIFGYKYKVMFRYAVERADYYRRWAEVRFENRGYFKTKEQAVTRLNQLKAAPEWRDS